ncbi:MAG: tetratricopeptide repeat protein [Deltaproteobacteria bacterium]|nr:tetratricopeptide repeat protein [Deltaproteobacteria bacterium]
METESLWHIKQLVEAKTGLLIREQDLKKFHEVLAARIKHHRLASPEDYQRLLRGHANTSDSEWQKLASLITIGESYFFRDKGQFAVLREQILPELITARQPDRFLRIWSAGCSSGEEPYSLAILMDELLPRQEYWQVRILGTDINGNALEKARRGIYGPWSFRMCRDELKRDYFTAQKDAWEIKGRIRNLVEFRQDNLLDLSKDLNSELQGVDLILCRNVFIYFNKEGISQALDRFSRLLREGGYLVTGHGELHGHGLVLKTFQARVCEGSVIYQKIAPGACQPAPKAPETVRPPQALPKRAPSAHRTRLKAARKVGKAPAVVTSPKPPETSSTLKDLFSRGDYAAAIALGDSIVKQDPKNFEVLHLLAQAYANKGQHDQAADLCREMLKTKTQAAIPYFLLAHIAEAQGDHEEAKKLLKKVLYLDPGFVGAYLELSGLYAREHDRKRAESMRQTAVRLLMRMAPDQMVEPYQEVTAGELVSLLKEKVR